MTKRHWRELVEIVGVVSIVASLLILAAQVRHSNEIAATEAALQIVDSFNTVHLERAANSDFAKLFAKLESPETHLTTATDASRIRGIAWSYINIMRSVQNAYENGLIDTATRDSYVQGFADQFRRWPGIANHYVEIFEAYESIQEIPVYEPIRNYIDSQATAETQ